MTAKELKVTEQKSRVAFEKPAPKTRKISPRLIGFSVATIFLVVCFCIPLYKLLQFATGNDLYSHIPLIPFISLYLIWMKRENLPRLFEPALRQTVFFLIAGLLAVVVYRVAPSEIFREIENYLAINTFAFLLFFTGICHFFLGKIFMRAIAFPMALLIFMLPFPGFLLSWIDTFLQHGSMVFAVLFLQMSGTPVIANDLHIRLPDCTLQVAPECSGIHSTLVLLITSLLGGWLFLRSPWKRALIALFVIPLALIRNGFRIFVIGRLCVAYGPQMIDSPIHHHGGPLFFALSLIPLLALLIFLRKTERPKQKP